MSKAEHWDQEAKSSYSESQLPEYVRGAEWFSHPYLEKLERIPGLGSLARWCRTFLDVDNGADLYEALDPRRSIQRLE